MDLDIKSLTDSERCWDIASIGLAAFVALGVAMEAVNQFDRLAEWLRLTGNEGAIYRKKIAHAGLLILIAALVLEVVVSMKSHDIGQRIIAGLNFEAEKLREQLVAQGPREALLRGDARTALVGSLKRFAGQNIDVRFSALVFFGRTGDWESVPNGDDILGLSHTFVGVLKDATWESPDRPIPTDSVGRGLRIEVAQDASRETLGAAKALTEALQEVPLSAEGPVLISEEKAKRLLNKVVVPEFGKETIILTVLTHP